MLPTPWYTWIDGVEPSAAAHETDDPVAASPNLPRHRRSLLLLLGSTLLLWLMVALAVAAFGGTGAASDAANIAAQRRQALQRPMLVMVNPGDLLRGGCGGVTPTRPMRPSLRRASTHAGQRRADATDHAICSRSAYPRSTLRSNT